MRVDSFAKIGATGSSNHLPADFLLNTDVRPYAELLPSSPPLIENPPDDEFFIDSDVDHYENQGVFHDGFEDIGV